MLMVQQYKSRDIVNLLADWNGRVGEGKEENILGQYGLSHRTNQGNCLIQFCNEIEYLSTSQTKNLHIEKTRGVFHKASFQWQMTQISGKSDDKFCETPPGDVRWNQIEYLLIKNKF